MIPLGVIAEITLGRARGLGGLRGPQLLDTELQQIGGLVREKLANPFDLLLSEFNWAGAQPDTLNALAERYIINSLFFSPPLSGGYSFELDNWRLDYTLY